MKRITMIVVVISAMIASFVVLPSSAQSADWNVLSRQEAKQKIAQYCADATLIVETNMTRLHNWLIRHTEGMSGNPSNRITHIKIVDYVDSSKLIEETGKTTRAYRNDMHSASLKKHLTNEEQYAYCKDRTDRELSHLKEIYNNLSLDGKIP